MMDFSKTYKRVLFILSCFFNITRGIEIFIRDKHDNDLKPSNHHGALVLILSENAFPITLSCVAESNVFWEKQSYLDETYLSNLNLLNLDDLSIKHNFKKYQNGSVHYQTDLALQKYSNAHVSKYSCNQNKLSSLTIMIFCEPFKASNIMNPTAHYKVTPILGQKLIYLPCRLLAPTFDISVEQIFTFSTRKIELDYDTLKNEFYIETSGKLTDIDKYTGMYRFSQIGTEKSDSVTVEITAPIDFEIFPKTNEILVESGSNIIVSCSSVTPLKLVVTGGNRYFNVTHSFQPKEMFRFSYTLNYPTEHFVTEEGTVKCTTVNTGIELHEWRFKTSGNMMLLELSEDEKGIQCRLRDQSTTDELKLTIYPCRNFDSCKFIVSNLKNFIPNVSTNNIETCGSNCQLFRPKITGGVVAKCSLGELERLEVFFTDLDFNTYKADEENSLELQNIRQHGHDIICKWTGFYLTDNVIWELSLPNNTILKEENSTTRVNSDGSYESIVHLTTIDSYKSVSCITSFASSKKVSHSSIFLITTLNFSTPSHLSLAQLNSSESVTFIFSVTKVAVEYVKCKVVVNSNDDCNCNKMQIQLKNKSNPKVGFATWKDNENGDSESFTD